MVQRTEDEDEVSMERTSGSVFAALGYPNPEEWERKTQLVIALDETIAARGLTGAQAAELLGLDEPDLEALRRGHIRTVTTTDLTAMLNALGRDVTIVVAELAPAREGARGRTSVVLADETAVAA